MTKYHVNQETGRPNQCHASSPEKCPYFDKENNTPAPHFDNKPDARKYIEEELNKQLGKTKTITKKLEATQEEDYSIVSIFPENLSILQKRIEKKNNRLKNAGVPERFELEVSDPYFVEDKKSKNSKIKKMVERMNVRVNKPHISFGNYEIVGSINKEEAGLIYKSFGNFENKDFKPDVMKCDHCGQKRHRSKTFIMKDKNTGEISQIGSACVGPYTGLQAPSLWVLDDNLENIDKDLKTTPSYHYDSVPVKDLLNISLAVSNGGNNFVSKKSAEIYEKEPTSSQVNSYINNNTGKVDDVVEDRLEKYRNSDDADKLIQQIKESDNNSEWMNNLKTIVSGENVSLKNFGLTVSAVSLLRQEKEKKKEPVFTSGFAGEKGDKLPKQKVKVIKKITQTVNDYYSYESKTKDRDILTLQDENGRMLTFFANREINVQEGNTVELKSARVNKQSNFNGNDQTIISRARFEEE